MLHIQNNDWRHTYTTIVMCDMKQCCVWYYCVIVHSYEWVMTHESCHTQEWLTSHIWMSLTHICMSHVTHMNESCHTYAWVMSHIWTVLHMRMRHVTHKNDWCHTYEWVLHTYAWVMSHIWMSHVTHMNESCHTNEWVMSHICMSHVTHMHESCHIYAWVMSHIWISLTQTRSKHDQSCHISNTKSWQRVANHMVPYHIPYGALSYTIWCLKASRGIPIWCLRHDMVYTSNV